MEKVSWDGNQTNNSTDSEMVVFTLPLNNLSGIGEICLVGILCLRIKADSMKQCVEAESTKAVIGILGTESKCKLTIKEAVLERAEALSLTSLLACSESTQLSERAEV